MSGTNIDWWERPRVIFIVVDNDSWILPYADTLVEEINKRGDKAKLCRNHHEIQKGVVAFYMGCVKVTPREILDKNRYNVVVHESDLPIGRGFSPLIWQILEGKNIIPVCLIEADDDVDAGCIYMKREIKLQGHELNHEIRHKQGQLTVEMCLDFLENSNPPVGIAQQGEPSIYCKRTPEDSKLDINKSIAEQFNLLRVVDNDRYPAFFEKDGCRYTL
ncbi:MAG: hypothetical protein OEY10_02055, partial [Nitrosopumilus sp.]|nr:hypothetical protein [Nitrosopumilus sp.]